MRSASLLVILLGCGDAVVDRSLPSTTTSGYPFPVNNGDADPDDPGPCVPDAVPSPCDTKCGNQEVTDSCGVRVRYICEPCECSVTADCADPYDSYCGNGYCVSCGAHGMECCPAGHAGTYGRRCSIINECDLHTNRCEPCGLAGAQCCTDEVNGHAYTYCRYPLACNDNTGVCQ
jgi:hypothetical protein